MRLGLLVLMSLALGCRTAPSPPEHFEPGLFTPERPDGDEMLREWFSSHLRAMDEPPIRPSATASSDVVRFLYLRSFHHPIAVRLERRFSGVTLTAVELDGAGGYEPGEIARRISRKVSSEHWAEVAQLLENSGFWDLPTSRERVSIDGARWILEASVDGRHHVVQRSSPDEPATLGFRATCVWLLDVAGFTLIGDELY